MTPDDSPHTLSALDREAFAWVARLTSGQATVADADALRAWCATSTEHQAAFARAQRLWRQVGGAGERVSNWSALRARPGDAASHRLRRRAFLGGALAAPVALAALAVWRPPLGLWPSMEELGADYRTGTGERRQVALARGVDVELDAQTSIQLRMRDRRAAFDGLELVSGQAAVETTASPFAVYAGIGCTIADSVPAGGTPVRLDVRHVDGETQVSCLSGSVRVTHAGGERRLQARQQVTYDRRAIAMAQSVEPADVAAWREGVLVFRQTALSRVVDELNRHRAGRVMVLNERSAARRVSGRFRVDAPDAVIEQLRLALDLEVRSYPGGIVVLT